MEECEGSRKGSLATICREQLLGQMITRITPKNISPFKIIQEQLCCMLLIVPGITFASSMVISFMYHVVLWSSDEHLCNNRDSCSLFPILLLFMSYCYMPFHPQTLLQFSFISSDSVLYCQISKSFSMLMLPQFCIIIIIFH